VEVKYAHAVLTIHANCADAKAGGRIANNTRETVDEIYPGYARTMSRIGKERGWRKMTWGSFVAQRGTQGALIVGNPDEVVERIIRHSKALGGISRITFVMNPDSLPHKKL
jgi:alkanesulfonate monooxygenase SsuD/methylene tetrahydromethanopterin reductase-like flavin-dependent oxidoreductase (luciferase family)